MRRSSGFTLLEVLIATSIFALISVITFQGIRSAMTVQDRVEKRARDMVEMQLVWTVLFQDFVNMARRPVREEGRAELYPAFDMDPEDSDCVVSFTRAGLPPSSALPAGMQRLAYCIRDSDLYRAVWPVLDRSGTTEVQESLLMEDVSEFTVETIPDDFDPEQEKKGFDDEDGSGAEEESEDEKDESLKQSARVELVKKNYELPVGVKVTIGVGGETFERWFPGGEEYQLDIDEEA